MHEEVITNPGTRARDAFAAMCEVAQRFAGWGFAGLFQNLSGNVAGLLPWAAARLQLPQHQEIAASALTVFGSEYPEEFDARWEIWEALSDELGVELDNRRGGLDEQWYAAEDGLERALVDHARSRV